MKYCQVYFRETNLCCCNPAILSTKRCAQHKDVPLHIPAIPGPGEKCYSDGCQYKASAVQWLGGGFECYACWNHVTG